MWKGARYFTQWRPTPHSRQSDWGRWLEDPISRGGGRTADRCDEASPRRRKRLYLAAAERGQAVAGRTTSSPGRARRSRSRCSREDAWSRTGWPSGREVQCTGRPSCRRPGSGSCSLVARPDCLARGCRRRTSSWRRWNLWTTTRRWRHRRSSLVTSPHVHASSRDLWHKVDRCSYSTPAAYFQGRQPVDGNTHCYYAWPPRPTTTSPAAEHYPPPFGRCQIILLGDGSRRVFSNFPLQGCYTKAKRPAVEHAMHRLIASPATLTITQPVRVWQQPGIRDVRRRKPTCFSASGSARQSVNTWSESGAVTRKMLMLLVFQPTWNGTLFHTLLRVSLPRYHCL